MHKTLLVLLSIVFIFMLINCDLEKAAQAEPSEASLEKVEDGMSVTYWGHIYDVLTGQDLTSLSASDFTVTAVYGGTRKACNVVITAASRAMASVIYYVNIPDNTQFTIEAEATGYADFRSTAVTASDSDATFIDGNETANHHSFLVTDHATGLQNIPMFPATTVANDYTLVLKSEVTDEVLSSATGSFRMHVDATSSTLAYRNNNFSGDYPTITGTFTSGSATVSAASLIYGADYDVFVYGVSGYRNELFQDVLFQAGDEIPGGYSATGSVGGSTAYLEMDAVGDENSLTVVSYNNVDSNGNDKVGLTSITVTFNHDIELHPAFAGNYVGSLVTLVTNDNDGDGTDPVWTTAEVATYTAGTYATYDNDATNTATNQCTLAVSGNTLTLTVTTSNITDDTADNLGFTLDLSGIAVRTSGTAEAFATAVMTDKTIYSRRTQ